MESDFFNMLFGYLSKINSNIILSRIVFQELKEVYEIKPEEKFKISIFKARI